MEAFVVGHGGHYGENTFVPRGTTVHVYSDVDTALLVRASLAALASGGLTSRGTVQHDPTPKAATIPNYALKPHDDETMALHLASMPPESDALLCLVSNQNDRGSTVWLVKSPDGEKELRLCTSPSECLMSWPMHGQRCRGLFAILRGTASEIHLLCCRVDYRSRPWPTAVAVGREQALARDAGYQPHQTFPENDNRVVPEITRRAHKIQPVELHSFSQPTQAQLLAANSDLQDVWRGINGLSPESFPTFQIIRDFHTDEEVPADLADAWRVADWQTAFWMYCQRDGADAATRARLIAYDAVLRCLATPTEAYVLSADWMDMLEPAGLPTVGVDDRLVESMATVTGELHRLVVLRDSPDMETSLLFRSLSDRTREFFDDPSEDPQTWLGEFTNTLHEVIEHYFWTLVEYLSRTLGQLTELLVAEYEAFRALMNGMIAAERSRRGGD